MRVKSGIMAGVMLLVIVTCFMLVAETGHTADPMSCCDEKNQIHISKKEINQTTQRQLDPLIATLPFLQKHELVQAESDQYKRSIKPYVPIASIGYFIQLE